MNLLEELKENQRRLDNGEIDNNEFEKQKKTILSQFAGNSKEAKKTEHSHGKLPKKSCYFGHTLIFVYDSKYNRCK